ncbi:MAG: metallophosphoesterase [Deltaproteobacteria bacterium]|nr:metallophosphoesterase [Deltaproteobacteria bacterium]
MFGNFALVLAAYIYLSLVHPLKAGLRSKLVILAVLLLSAGRLAILRRVFGGLGGVECPWLLLIVTSLFQGTSLILFLLCIPKDLLRLSSFAAGLFRRKAAGARLRRLLASGAFAGALAAASFLLSGYSLWQAARVPEVREQTVYLNSWPDALDGLRVAVISDLHISRFFDAGWTRGVVAKVNGLRPELILIPGDLVDGEVDVRAPETSPLADLESPNGIYMCVGNHEYISVLWDWLPAFRNLGIRNLYNQHETIVIRGEELVLAGVTDPVSERWHLPGPDLQRALAGVPPDGPPVILLDHRPGHAPANAMDGRVRLQLSGHTHGGLIPVLSSFVARANKGFLKGWYEVGSLMMYVHPGTGLWSGLPMRLFNPSEITLLTVKSSPPPGGQPEGEPRSVPGAPEAGGPPALPRSGTPPAVVQPSGQPAGTGDEAPEASGEYGTGEGPVTPGQDPGDGGPGTADGGSGDAGPATSDGDAGGAGPEDGDGDAEDAGSETGDGEPEDSGPGAVEEDPGAEAPVTAE